ncbi:hypothetical protein AB0C02_20940 [Micromonospora sp. NPDC048999]|uniref:hypothetical protein n=1 Tax=Micromonospora sp. NPDC048999 TaxID=3155391 RepID=UPI00340F2FDD
MTAIGVWLHVVVPILLVALLARALWVIVAVEVCARWLLTAPAPTGTDRSQAPWLVILLPMLREQSVAPETIAAFTALEYPHGRAAVVVITTERETTARARHRSQLPALAAHQPLRAEHLRGIFPATRCRAVAEDVSAAPPNDHLAILAERFDAEPTTAEVVAALTADQPANRLPLVHLHQPDVGGRKAGQLNFALDHLDQVLGPLGWHDTDDTNSTFAVVYDADAIPDARTLHAFANAVATRIAHTGTTPALIQQQRLPLLGRRPFPNGPIGLLLTGEWAYQLRRSLGIELARIRLHAYLFSSPLPPWLRTWLRPMVYAVGCGMAVHLPTIRALGGFPEPMEDLGTGHRLSLLGAQLTATTVAVLDEPYTEPTGLANLHALAFTASARPDRHAQAVAHLPATISRPAKALLITREWADEAAWLIGAPLAAAAVACAWWAGPQWVAIAVLGILLHGPLLTARLLALAPVLHAAVRPPRSADRLPLASPRHPVAVIAASPLQPFVRMAGPWKLIFRKVTRRHRGFGKTER